jgi:hypothetical protein
MDVDANECYFMGSVENRFAAVPGVRDILAKGR